jgi:hypothetical protein
MNTYILYIDIYTPVHDCMCISAKIEAPLDSQNWSLLVHFPPGVDPSFPQVWCSIGGSEEGVPEMELSIAGLALDRLKWRKH